MPFLIMAVSIGIWFMSDSFQPHKGCRHYRQCLTVIKGATLTSLYLSGNYYVVRELGSYLLGSSAHPGKPRISLGLAFLDINGGHSRVVYIRGHPEKKSYFFMDRIIAYCRYYFHHKILLSPVTGRMGDDAGRHRDPSYRLWFDPLSQNTQAWIHIAGK